MDDATSLKLFTAFGEALREWKNKKN